MAIYRGKKVSLNKVMRGDVKKFKVFVKKGSRVIKVNFGDKNMKIKKKALEEKENMARNIYLISLIHCLIQATWKSLKKQLRKVWY